MQWDYISVVQYLVDGLQFGILGNNYFIVRVWQAAPYLTELTYRYCLFICSLDKYCGCPLQLLHTICPHMADMVPSVSDWWGE